MVRPLYRLQEGRKPNNLLHGYITPVKKEGRQGEMVTGRRAAYVKYGDKRLEPKGTGKR